MPITKTKLILGSTVAALAVAAPLAVAASTTTLKAALTGKAVVPGPADADGRGQATIVVKGSRVCHSLIYSKISAPDGGHIHRGARGISGPVVAALFMGRAKKTGCTTVTARLAREIATKPGSFYVQLHNPAFEKGAIRGQLRKG